MFTTPDGQPLHPDFLTRRFVRLVEDSGLPPVRLHDLRHGAASLAHCAGADLKTLQEQLGHTSIVLTADTYTSVLHEQHVKAAAATARLVPGTRRRKGSVTGPRKSAAPQPASRPKPRRARRSSTKSRRRQGRPRAPHTRPAKIKAV
ncbi:tyrosine-type recombinase/integrase [Paractinoplanes globisporus]|uniref:Tyrosine-type recombinase/integrase n=1 Tax=Paractinoplanes globisporus TaxID=113565 RepID=A0ABW6WDB6_9ACTN|nr:tyrosine-type recombinase/integrase [Actinoplanes globisporus]